MKERKEKKPWNPVAAAVFFITCLLILAVAVVGIIDNRVPVISLNGGNEITLEYGSRFQDPGYKAESSGSVFGVLGWPFGVEARGYVNTTELGEYEIIYSTEFMGMEAQSIRHISVVDSTGPVITLDRKEGYSPSWLDGYEEEGYHAMDDYDGDLTNQVVRVDHGGYITYTVTDSAGNVSTIERTVAYRGGMPGITLSGETELTIEKSRSYNEPGFSAYDAEGNDLSNEIVVSGVVNTSEPGDYEIFYSLTNHAGEQVSARRLVHVIKPEIPDTVIPNGKVIYLTFDDGPGPYTPQLLEILSKYGVRATFFVTGDDPDYNYLIAREYNEGHAIGVHSMTHNYSTIYASEDAFLRDFDAVEDLIYEQTGTYTKLFRFPGGSSNTVSSFNPGIMSRLASMMQDRGYKYFDWNVLSGDAGDTTQTSKVISNIENGCSENNPAVVLQHDIKNFSVNAVESVIIWGLNNGYTFLPLDLTSYDAHHTINN